MSLRKTTIIGAFSLLTAGFFSGPANAEWFFHPERCPEIARHHANPVEVPPGDPVALCPAAAWTWQGEPRHKTKRPAPAVIYFHHGKRHYYRHGPGGAAIRIHIP